MANQLFFLGRNEGFLVQARDRNYTQGKQMTKVKIKIGFTHETNSSMWLKQPPEAERFCQGQCLPRTATCMMASLFFSSLPLPCDMVQLYEKNNYMAP